MTVDVTGRIDRVLLDLRSLGAEIADCDSGYSVEEATFEGGAVASRIDSVAGLIPEPLPVDYTYFLSLCAGFIGMDFHNGYVVHTPEQVVRLFRQAGAPKRITTAAGEGAVLPVAGDGGGNLFLLQVRMPQVILRWDHEVGDADDAAAAGHPGLQPVCDSFVSFLERIREDWRHFLGPDPGSWVYLT